MIFVTTGSQEPFDRMIKCIDELALNLPNHEFVAQVFHGKYKAVNIKTLEFITPKDYNKFILNSSLVIAHAGMGTILSVLQTDKPLLIFPRLAAMKETRNDHQVATALWFKKNNYLYTAFTEDELKESAIKLINENCNTNIKINGDASHQLITSLRNHIQSIHPNKKRTAYE